MCFLPISNHKSVRSISFYFEPSFPGLLEGTPPPFMIEERLKEARDPFTTQNKDSLLSKIISKFHKPEHVFYEDSFSEENLPSYYCIASFESTEPTDSKAMFSYLTISWFMDLNKDRDLQSSIEQALKDFDWNKYALNGDY